MTARRLIPTLRTGSLVLTLMVSAYTASLFADEATPPAIENKTASATEAKQPAKAQGILPLNELRIFTEVMHRIKTSYVEDIDDKTLLDNAIKGMMGGLDPHSSYLKPSEFTNLEESTSGEFGGLGIEVSLEDGLIRVIAPIDETPAQRAGVEAGDLIIKLDNKPVKGMPLKKAIEMMRGNPGEPINLTIIRESSNQPLNLTVVRDIIKVLSVRQHFLEPGYGYIRLSRFQVDSGKEVLDAIDTLKKEQDSQPIQGLVLDLRNNPGGVLQAAVEVTDAFLSNGLIVDTKGRIDNVNMSYSATSENISGDIPLVVLINSGSASASEIVAGALQDHHRAVVLGTPSFGKGSVQTVLPLSTNEEYGLKLTTALYYTPNGRSIQAEGIKPDIHVDLAKVTHTRTNNYRESDLQGHLENSNGNDKKTKGHKGQKGKKVQKGQKVDAKAAKPLDETDYQLSQALNILKGIRISQKSNSTGTLLVAPATQQSAEATTIQKF